MATLNELNEIAKEKQNKLIAGENITIDKETSEISSDGYSKDDVDGLINTIADEISGKQDKLTAGDNITINGTTISSKDTTYSAGDNITISSNNEISASTPDIDAQSEDDVLNLSSSTSSSKVTITGSINLEELKRIILQTVDIGNTGDILFYDSDNNKKYIVGYSEWSNNKSNYSASRFEPIGIVAIPASHNVYGTGECGIMSLKHMRYDDPDNGGSSESMYWGYNSLLINTAHTYKPDCGYTNSPSDDGEITNFTSNTIYLPTDFGSYNTYAKDTNSKYYYNSSSYHAGISPYLTNGYRNPTYYQTSSPASSENLFAYFNGADLSSSILDNATGQSDWKTATSITNSYSSGYYPAACCCWRYYTNGTSRGDWFLPSAGELGYACVRRDFLNNVMTELNSTYGSSTCSTLDSYYYWSSSEYSSSYAFDVGFNNGNVYYSNKYSFCFVRAFYRMVP